MLVIACTFFLLQLSTIQGLKSGSNALTEMGSQLSAAMIGSFNIQIFGATKYSDTFVVSYLLKIIPQYDILLIQEIRDSTGASIFSLLNDINKLGGKQYNMVISDRLGRTSSKEQYAYFYNKNMFAVESTHQFPDVDNVLERPPYGVVFTSVHTAISRFGLVGIHTQPSNAVVEINYLSTVYNYMVGVMKTKNIMTMGDFNAGCSYATVAQLMVTSFRSDSRFTWLVGDDVDTTVGSSACAYDRFVVAGAELLQAVIPGSVGPFQFDHAYGLTQQQAEEISDHYPIELLLFGKLSDYIRSSTRLAQSVIIDGNIDVSSVTVVNSTLTDNAGFDEVKRIRSGWTCALVTLKKENVTDVTQALLNFQSQYPTLINSDLIAMVKAYVDELQPLDDVTQFPGNLGSPGVSYKLELEYGDKVKLRILVSRLVFDNL